MAEKTRPLTEVEWAQAMVDGRRVTDRKGEKWAIDSICLGGMELSREAFFSELPPGMPRGEVSWAVDIEAAPELLAWADTGGPCVVEEGSAAAVTVPLESLIAIERLSHEMFSAFDEADIEDMGGPVRNSALALHGAIDRLVIAGRKRATTGRAGS